MQSSVCKHQFHEMKRVNAISVDVEDYFQVSAFEESIRRDQWDSIEHRIKGSMDKVLQIFADRNTQATFFMLSWLAERYPELVKQIVGQGHELASHGSSHHRVTDLSKKEFKEDIERSKKILEDLSGVEVKGYRAPSYSIGESNVWALNIVAEAGYQYSSSIYPVKHDHYGFPNAPRFAFKDTQTGLVEIPITTMKLANRVFPAGGGGFFRLYPYALSRWIISRVNKVDQQSAVFYFHPWELDPSQPRQANLSAKTRFRHYLNLHKMESRIKRLINDFHWGRMDEIFLDNDILGDFPLTS